MPEPRNDWERRYQASFGDGADQSRPHRKTTSRTLRMLDGLSFIGRTWWVLWMLFTLAGFGLRGLGVDVPPAVEGAVFFASLVGFMVLRRRDARRAKALDH